MLLIGSSRWYIVACMHVSNALRHWWYHFYDNYGISLFLPFKETVCDSSSEYHRSWEGDTFIWDFPKIVRGDNKLCDHRFTYSREILPARRPASCTHTLRPYPYHCITHQPQSQTEVIPQGDYWVHSVLPHRENLTFNLILKPQTNVYIEIDKGNPCKSRIITVGQARNGTRPLRRPVWAYRIL